MALGGQAATQDPALGKREKWEPKKGSHRGWGTWEGGRGQQGRGWEQVSEPGPWSPRAGMSHQSAEQDGRAERGARPASP